MDSVLQVPFKPIDFLSRDIARRAACRRHDRPAVEPPAEAVRKARAGVPGQVGGRGAGPASGWRSAAGPSRDWLKVTYAEAKRQVDAVTQALLDRGFGPDKPVMILSSNSIEFALLSMAAMQARAPLAPVSPAYSVMSQDHAKLKYVFDLIKPGLVFVQNGEIYADALAALDLDGVLLVHVDKPPPRMQSLPWSELVATRPTDAVQRSIDRDRAQDRRQVPVHLGQHRHAQGGDQHPGDDVRQPGDGPDGAGAQGRAIPCRCMLDWLPWNHTMGGNATFQGNLAEGGTTWIDDGKPLPGLFEETLRNLREISPTYFRQRAGGLRHARDGAREGRGAGAEVLQEPELARLWRRHPAERSLRAHGSGWR